MRPKPRQGNVWYKADCAAAIRLDAQGKFIPHSIDAHMALAKAIPNIISFVRFLLALAFPMLPHHLYLPTIMVGAATDFFDGFLARIFHAQSALGRLLDPIADKAFFISVLLTLTVRGDVTWWQLALACARDVVVIVQALYITARRDWYAFAEMKPSAFGKLTTVLVFAWIVAVLIGELSFAAMPLFAFSAASSAVTAAGYARQFVLRLMDEHASIRRNQL
jgi:cardiolipin synthase